jgi:predicted HTH domain antitoxin
VSCMEPFDVKAGDPGDHRSVALRLFEAGELTLAQAAKLADLSLEAFLDLLVEAGIPAVDYSPDELAEELEVVRKPVR